MRLECEGFFRAVWGHTCAEVPSIVVAMKGAEGQTAL